MNRLRRAADIACYELKQMRAKRKQKEQARAERRQRELDRREQLKREIEQIRWRA